MQTVYNRRHAIGAALALTTLRPSLASSTSRERLLYDSPAYTAITAPTAAARAALAAYTPELYSPGLEGRALMQDIRRRLPQVIEQNFARMDAPRVARYMASSKPAELRALATVYNSASEQTARPARLLDVLAGSMTARQLGVMAQHFGFGPVYAAVVRTAPGKMQNFLQVADNSIREPSSYAGGLPIELQTLREIWTEIRTAPLGANSLLVALYQFYAKVSGPLGKALAFGSLLGTGIAYVISENDPELWESIGERLYQAWHYDYWPWITTIIRAEKESRGTRRGLFDVGEDWAATLQYTGGDYEAVWEWREVGGGGVGAGGGGEGGWCGVGCVPWQGFP